MSRDPNDSGRACNSSAGDLHALGSLKRGAALTAVESAMTPAGPIIQFRGRAPLAISECSIDVPLGVLVQLLGGLAGAAVQSGIAVGTDQSQAAAGRTPT